PLVFKAETNLEGVELVATRDYSEFDDYLNLKVSHLRGQGVIDHDPKVMAFTFPSFQAVKNHVYGPGLTRIIEQD
ncbi:MAG: hypothetical protein JSW25_01200, partial [Thermoplasmata archaeon]